MSNWRRLRTDRLLELVVTAPFVEMHSGPGPRFPGRLRRRARRSPYGALQPHRLVQGARSARRGGLGAPRGPGAHQAAPPGNPRRYRRIPISRRTAGKSAPATGSITVKTWSQRMSTTGSPTASTSRWLCSRRSARSTTASSATIGLRHTFIPEWKWFSPTASIGTGYQNIVGQGAAGAARKPQPTGLRVARSPRIHHPTLHVARRLAPLRRLQQPECL